MAPVDMGGTEPLVYTLYRGTSTASLAPLKSRSGGPWIDTYDDGLPQGQPVVYAMSGRNSAGEGPLSEPITVTTLTHVPLTADEGCAVSTDVFSPNDGLETFVADPGMTRVWGSFSHASVQCYPRNFSGFSLTIGVTHGTRLSPGVYAVKPVFEDGGLSLHISNGSGMSCTQPTGTVVVHQALHNLGPNVDALSMDFDVTCPAATPYRAAGSVRWHAGGPIRAADLRDVPSTQGTPLGESSTTDATFVNLGTEAVSVSSVELRATASTDWSVVRDDCSGRSIEPGQTCTIGLSYSPTATGLMTTTRLAVVADTVVGEHVEILRGVPKVTLSSGGVRDGVILSWDATPGVVYSILRGPSWNSLTKIATSTGPSFIDRTAPPFPTPSTYAVEFQTAAGPVRSTSPAGAGRMLDDLVTVSQDAGVATGRLELRPSMGGPTLTLRCCAVLSAAASLTSPDVAVIESSGLGTSRLRIVGTLDGSTKYVSPDNATRTLIRPSWSAGSLVAYEVVDALNGRRHLEVLNVATSTTTVVPNSQGLSDPAFTPDGRALIAVDSTAPGAHLQRISLTGTRQGTRRPIPGTASGLTPSISPDGSRLAFTTRTSVHGRPATTVRATTSWGGTVATWSSFVGHLDEVGWSADQRALFVAASTPRGGGSDIFAISTTTGRSTRVESTPTEERSVSARGPRPRVSLTASAPPRSDISGDSRPDLLARDSAGRLYLHRGNGAGGWLPRTTIGSGWSQYTAIVQGSDLDLDGANDVLARDAAGVLWLYAGDGRGSFLARSRLSAGWNGMTTIVGPGDMTGDGAPDLLARSTSGTMYVFAGGPNLTLKPGVAIGTGWTSMTALSAAGDVDRDGRADLLARDGTGVTWLYRGNGSSGFLGRVSLGPALSTAAAFVGGGDWNGDGNPDVLATDRTGRLWLHPGRGPKAWSSPTQVGTGFAGLTIA